MPKISALRLKSLAKEFAKDAVVSDGTVLKCSICDVNINVDEKHQKQSINQHVNPARHQSRIRNSSAKQTFINKAFENAEQQAVIKKEFELELTSAFVQSGIPLFKLNSVPLKAFLEKYLKRHIPDQSTLRKNYIHPIYEISTKKVLSVIGDSPVCFIVDETTDEMYRYVLNILVAPLNGEPVKPMLLKMYSLDKTNNTTIMQSFNDACSFLWPSGIQYEKVWLVVTDQASYMLLAFSILKNMFTNLKHVTCLTHSLHRVCETIRDEYTMANNFVKQMRKVLLKAPARIQIYKDVTGLPLPPDAVVTRWGTWIRCCIFYCNNFSKIVLFLNELPLDSKAVEEAKALALNNIVKDELFNVATYNFLPMAIEKLERELIPKEEQWNIFKEASSLLDGFAKEKYVSSLGRNPDVEEFAVEIDPEIRFKSRFAPLVYVDVEQSFSQYKLILSDRWKKLTFENIEMYNVIAFNQFLFN